MMTIPAPYAGLLLTFYSLLWFALGARFHRVFESPASPRRALKLVHTRSESTK